MNTSSPARRMLGLLGWLALCLVAAGIGAAATAAARGFYEQLMRPEWAPPGSVFGPVWTTLYILMAIAAWLVWREHGFRGAKTALTLFILQLAFNALWSWVFFAWREGAWAFAEVLLLWGLIVATVASFWRLSRAGAVLLLPYLAWVSFAAALTWATWRLNPQLL